MASGPPARPRREVGLAELLRWPSALERRIARRYLQSRRRRRGASLSTLISIGGVAVGVMALIVVLGIMNGLMDDLRERILSAQPHVRIRRTLTPEIAHRRDPGHQGRAGVIDAARHPQRQRLAQHLVVPRRLVVRVQQQVRMPFDQAWHHGRTGQRDAASSGRRGRGSRRTCRLDAIAAHHHHPPGVRALAVEDPIRPEDDAVLLGSGQHRATEHQHERGRHLHARIIFAPAANRQIATMPRVVAASKATTEDTEDTE